MASTYEPIATNTLASAATSITFSSIPSTYTDLRIVFWSSTGSADNANGFRFNGDTGSNYSNTTLQGNGSSATSFRNTNSTWMVEIMGGGLTGGMMATADILNYANTTTYKTAIGRSERDSGGRATTAVVGLWRSTAAINSVTILTGTANTFPVGTIATLYGIKAA